MMKTYTYARKEILKEYRHAGMGFCASLVPLLLLRPSSVIVYILGSMVCLFAVYGIRALDRGRLHIRLTEKEICATGIRTKSIKWEELEQVKLNYFSTRRDRENGWMQLKLNGRGVRLRIESTVTDFEGLVDTCASIALSKGLSLDPASIRNLQALGVSSDTLRQHDFHVAEKGS